MIVHKYHNVYGRAVISSVVSAGLWNECLNQCTVLYSIWKSFIFISVGHVHVLPTWIQNPRSAGKSDSEKWAKHRFYLGGHQQEHEADQLTAQTPATGLPFHKKRYIQLHVRGSSYTGTRIPCLRKRFPLELATRSELLNESRLQITRLNFKKCNR